MMAPVASCAARATLTEPRGKKASARRKGGRLAGARSGPRRVLRSTPHGGSRRGHCARSQISSLKTPDVRTGRRSHWFDFPVSTVAVVNIINFTDKDSGQAGFVGVRVDGA